MPYCNRDPKRDHNVENHPFRFRVGFLSYQPSPCTSVEPHKTILERTVVFAEPLSRLQVTLGIEAVWLHRLQAS